MAQFATKDLLSLNRMGSKVAAEVAKAGKIANQYFEKIDKSLLYHADVLRNTDWLLSTGNPKAKDEMLQNIQPGVLLEGM